MNPSTPSALKARSTPSPATHTPGPWQICRLHPDPETNRTFIQIFPESDFRQSQEIASVYCAPDGSVRHANARLIASAPELLAAMEETERNATWSDEDTVVDLRARLDNLSGYAELILARLAIQKATQ